MTEATATFTNWAIDEKPLVSARRIAISLCVLSLMLPFAYDMLELSLMSIRFYLPPFITAMTVALNLLGVLVGTWLQQHIRPFSDAEIILWLIGGGIAITCVSSYTVCV